MPLFRLFALTHAVARATTGRHLFLAACTCLGVSLFSAAPASATSVALNSPEAKVVLQTYFEQTILPWLSEPTLLGAIRKQNETTAGLSEADVLELDKTWRAQVGTEDQPMVDQVIHNNVSDFFVHSIADNGGIIAEIFIMDAKGLNVAASMPTSDYWQGDEAKFQQTFSVGTDAIHVGDIEFDASTGVSQSQISATITDPATGEPIGAITVGVIADILM
ncbi:PDC sensor domain-containing protein [Celeribacter baekdonensis]|uniref:PDC sensor domain-containing protein n=1 Tax=Celeribacter baekdonensis TaxID=875171 RepID=UPI003A900B6A